MRKSIFKIFLLLFVFSTQLYSQSSPYEISLPYSCGFEDSLENQKWVINAGSEGPLCTDQWMIGNLDYVEGYNSLYISCDTGKTMTYGAKANYVMAYRPIVIPKPDSVTTERCRVNVSFEWKGGSARDVSVLNYYVVPDYAIKDYLNSNSKKSALPSVLKNPKKKLYGSSSWQEYSSAEGITYDNTFYLVFIWQNSNGNDSLAELSMCIDDIQISSGNCPKPTSLNVQAVDDSLVITWDGSHQKYDLEYRLPGLKTWRQMHGLVYEDYSEKKEVVLTDLPEGVYDVRVRGICGESEKSAWLTQTDIIVFSPDRHCINYVKLDNNPDVTCLIGECGLGLPTPWEPNDQLFVTGLGIDYGFNANSINYGHKDMYSRHTVNWKQGEYDPRTGNQLRTIPEGSLASVRLGNWDINAEAEAIRYRYLVDTMQAKIILMKYAVVLEAPGHGLENDPYFRLRLKDENGNTISTTCGDFEFSPMNTAIDWNVYEAYVWKDWTTIGMNIAKYHGQVIEIELITRDCRQTGHAGYAYFTLDCADAVIKNSSCGDEDFITIEAPEGFEYSWTKQEDRSKVISTDRTLSVPATDTTTYYCKVDYIGMKGCGFELSTLVQPRIPFADFDVKWEPQGCKNRVVLTNKSCVHTKVDGKEVATSEPCETYYWNINNGKYESQEKDLVYVAPNEGGEIFITLVSGIANDKCLGDKIVKFTVPPIYDKVDSLYKKKCEADIEYFGDQLILKDGIYVDEDTTWCGCDSLTVLDVKFLPAPEDTYVYDTICSDYGYVFNGQIYAEGGEYDIWLKTEELGCDSLVILNLTKMTPMAATIRSEYRSVCADDERLYVDYDVVSGKREPFEYSVLFDAFAKQYGFEDADFKIDETDKYFEIPIPADCRPNTYTATIVVRDSVAYCDEITLPVQFDVYYSSDILQPKFDNLIAVLNSDSNGGYSFVEGAYKWYKNDSLLVGMNDSYLYLDEFGEIFGGDCYYMEVTRVDDGVEMRTCAICPDVYVAIDDIEGVEDMISATVLSAGQPILLENAGIGDVNIYTLTGQLLHSYRIDLDNNQIPAPAVGGLYILQIKTEDRNITYKIWVK